MSTDTGTGVAFTDNGAEDQEGNLTAVHGRSGHDRDWTGMRSAGDSAFPVMPIIRKNGSSFETLVRRLSPTLKRITCRMNGHFSFVDDQDLFQEALIHLWTHFASGELHDKTDSYMLQGCYFHLKNYIRKTQDPAVLLSLSHTADEEGPRPEEILDAQSLVSYDEVDGNLQIEAMAESGITQREKDVLLFCLEGMTTREIGKKLGISHVSVVKIRNRIREKYARLNG
jgi:RNA polymerase sigma factor (sigma-70 family)